MYADRTVIRILEISGLVQSTEGGSDSLSWSTIFGVPVAWGVSTVKNDFHVAIANTNVPGGFTGVVPKAKNAREAEACHRVCSEGACNGTRGVWGDFEHLFRG